MINLNLVNRLKNIIEPFKQSIQEYLNKGYTYKDISYILNLKNGKQLLNYNTKNWKLKRQKATLYCLNCRKKLYNDQVKFCSSSCSASYNNIRRKKIIYGTKFLNCRVCNSKVKVDSRASRIICNSCKIKSTSTKLKRKNKKVAKTIKSYKTKCNLNFCKNCGKICKKRKQYCSDCLYTYYKIYRPRCEFKFDPLDYCDWFKCELIKTYGKYSPKNKGNNLNGVSRDHMFSVKEGFRLGVDPKIIAHPANCRLMQHFENNCKKTNCSITLEELKGRIEVFDHKYLKK